MHGFTIDYHHNHWCFAYQKFSFGNPHSLAPPIQAVAVSQRFRSGRRMVGKMWPNL